MKVFITGATSTIGNHLVNLLTLEGITLHLLVRDIKKASYFNQNNIKLFQGDIDSEEALIQAMSGCTHVFHLAALTRVWEKNPSRYYEVNVGGTLNVLKVAKSLGISRVVITSSAGGYGPSINSVVTEEKVREIGFFNDYECSKVLCELKAKEFSIAENLDVVIVSPTRVYGPTLDAEVSSITLLFDQYVNHSWRLIPGDGQEVGNYAYIEDVAYGHLLAMRHGKSGESYILGGHNITYNTFFRILAEQSNIRRKMIHAPFFLQNAYARLELFKARYISGVAKITPQWLAKGKYHWEADCSKAINALGYQVTPMEEAFSNTITFLKRKVNETNH
ncbi:MAG: NAD-dependent epimerase/dehydratase family protein [Flavobacteriales bacterium]|jgi:nucleoside-diphosphate-sugar epimerase